MDIKVAFSGSGFLGAVHAGAYCALLDWGYKATEVAGTSGGSIIASLIATRNNTQESLKEIAIKESFSGFLSFNLWCLITKRAYSTGDKLEAWLHSKLGDITFEKAEIPLTVLSTDVTNGVSYVFSAETTPNFPIYKACRASASIPFVYKPVLLDTKPTIALADGGIINNIPVDRLKVDSTPRIGIELQSPYIGKDPSSPIDYGKALISLLMESNESTRVAIESLSGANIIPVNASGYNFLDDNLSTEQKTALFNLGHDAVTNYLIKKNKS